MVVWMCASAYFAGMQRYFPIVADEATQALHCANNYGDAL